LHSYLDIEDSDEPYLDGIKYHAMPPLKRFRDMEHLSGGEKTMAALALLFAIHSYQPSPFFVLDEVDAALDNTNVARIANYIQDHAAPGMQFIVISLKTGLFQNSEALVGIYRDQVENSSKSLTLDVSLLCFSLQSHTDNFPTAAKIHLARSGGIHVDCVMTFCFVIALRFHICRLLSLTGFSRFSRVIADEMELSSSCFLLTRPLIDTSLRSF
jgi:hypothetical protein